MTEPFNKIAAQLPTLGVILKVHQRTASLNKVLEQLATWPGRLVSRMRVVVLEDKLVAPAVDDIVMGSDIVDQVIRLDYQVVGPEGEKFMQASNVGLAAIESFNPNWIWYADDDRWFEPGYENDVAGALLNPDVDVWNIRSMFFWEDRGIREDFFKHNAPLLWRWRPGARLDPARMLECPPVIYEAAKATGRMGQLSYRLLDVGYISSKERQRVFDAYAQAGKIDSLTTSLLDESVQLRAYEHGDQWRP
jgi:hypothetical protein